MKPRQELPTPSGHSVFIGKRATLNVFGHLRAILKVFELLSKYIPMPLNSQILHVTCRFGQPYTPFVDKAETRRRS